MVSMKLLVAFAVLLVMAAAYPATEEESGTQDGHGRQGGRGHHHRSGGHHGHKGECTLKRLSFYKDLDEEIKEKFKAIAKNKDLTRDEKKEQMMQLAQEEFTPEQFTEYQRVKTEHEQRKMERKAEMDSKIAAMSPNARVAAEKIRALMEDDSLDWDDKKSQIRAIKEDLSESEQAELDQLRDGHHHGRHRRYGKNKYAKWIKKASNFGMNDEDDE